MKFMTFDILNHGKHIEIRIIKYLVIKLLNMFYLREDGYIEEKG